MKKRYLASSVILYWVFAFSLIRYFYPTVTTLWETFIYITGRSLFLTGLVVWITTLLVMLLNSSYPHVLGILQRFRPNYASRLDDFTKSFTVKLIENLTSQFGIFGDQSRQMMLYIPNADQQSHETLVNYKKNKSSSNNGFCEISQDALSRHLMSKETANLIDKLNSDGSSKKFDKTMYDMQCYLKDFNKEAEITKFEIYQSSMHWLSDAFGIYHTFIVFKTVDIEGKYWWSVEKNTEYIVIQRSRNKFAVVNRLKRHYRKNVEVIPGGNRDPAVAEPGQDTRTMTNLLTTLWAHNITEKYHVVKASCQTFVQFIAKANSQAFVNLFVNERITSFQPSALPFSASHRNTEFEPIINMLTKFPEWPPLFAIVYLGDAVLLENLLSNSKKYQNHTDVNLVAYGTTVLQLAILLSRTKMVEILLRNPQLDLKTPHDKGDSNFPWKNMSEYHTAAAFTDDTEIIELLSKSDKVNKDKDTSSGRNALHFAVMKSNVITVGHLLKTNKIDSIARDDSGLSPLHLAAQHTDNTNIIDLLLKANKKQKNDTGIDAVDNQKKTALHHAVIGSNVTAARHLIEKGANPIQADNELTTPLVLAAKHAKDMAIVRLLLENETVDKELSVTGGDRVFNCAIENPNAGLSNEIEHLLRSRGIIRKQQIPPKDDKLDQIKSCTANQEGNCEEEQETRREMNKPTAAAAQTTVLTEGEGERIWV